MVDGRRREDWQHTAQLSAMLANTVRDKRKRRKPYTIKDFYPFAKSQNGKPVDIKQILPFIHGRPGGARAKDVGQ